MIAGRRVHDTKKSESALSSAVSISNSVNPGQTAAYGALRS